MALLSLRRGVLDDRLSAERLEALLSDGAERGAAPLAEAPALVPLATRLGGVMLDKRFSRPEFLGVVDAGARTNLRGPDSRCALRRPGRNRGFLHRILSAGRIVLGWRACRR